MHQDYFEIDFVTADRAFDFYFNKNNNLLQERLIIPSTFKELPKAVSTARPKKKNTTVRIRYNEIMTYAQYVAKHASRSEDVTLEVIEKLKSIIKYITPSSESNNENLIIEPKAKKRQTKKYKVRLKIPKKNKKCKVCEKLGVDFQYDQAICNYCKGLLEIVQYLPDNETSKNFR